MKTDMVVYLAIFSGGFTMKIWLKELRRFKIFVVEPGGFRSIIVQTSQVLELKNLDLIGFKTL
jgi:hypothetical protein